MIDCILSKDDSSQSDEFTKISLYSICAKEYLESCPKREIRVNHRIRAFKPVHLTSVQVESDILVKFSVNEINNQLSEQMNECHVVSV